MEDVSGCFYYYHLSYNFLLLMKTVDFDQMPRSVASDLGLYCLPVSLLWDTRHKMGKRDWIYVVCFPPCFTMETTLATYCLFLCSQYSRPKRGLL